MRKITGVVLVLMSLFSLIRLILVSYGRITHVYLDFIVIILLCLLILYIEQPFKKREKEQEKKQWIQ